MAEVEREGERLDDHRPDRKIEAAAVRVRRPRPRRHPDETVLEGIVGEQRRVEVVGENAVVRLLGRAVAAEEAVAREEIAERLVGIEVHARPGRHRAARLRGDDRATAQTGVHRGQDLVDADLAVAVAIGREAVIEREAGQPDVHRGHGLVDRDLAVAVAVARAALRGRAAAEGKQQGQRRQQAGEAPRSGVEGDQRAASDRCEQIRFSSDPITRRPGSPRATADRACSRTAPGRG